MRSIPVHLSHGSYEIRVGRRLLFSLEDQLQQLQLGAPYLVVSQTRILDAVARGLPKRWNVARIPDGERAKTLTSVSRLLDAMFKHRLTRQSTVVALGGGVVGDVAGFAASIYMRGIALVHVPTTLLAQVDSSVGGKTGVNHRVGKNLIGTFFQPRFVLTDCSLLRTLPEREFVSGLFEAVKYGVIRSPELFSEFESNVRAFLKRDLDALERLVGSCVAIKADVVNADEKETDLRRILNFGHTIGHAIEVAGNFRRFKHGEAVAYGMIAASRIAEALGRLQTGERVRIERVVHTIGRLPGLANLEPHKILGALQRDKKVSNGKVHFVLPLAIGRVEITPEVPFAVVNEVVRQLLDECRKAN